MVNILWGIERVSTYDGDGGRREGCMVLVVMVVQGIECRVECWSWLRMIG